MLANPNSGCPLRKDSYLLFFSFMHCPVSTISSIVAFCWFKSMDCFVYAVVAVSVDTQLVSLIPLN
jgi:hypothetical protein